MSLQLQITRLMIIFILYIRLILYREQAAHIPKKQGEHIHRIGIAELPSISSMHR